MILKNLWKQPIGRMYWLIVFGLCGLISLQAYIIIQGAKIQKDKFEQHVWDLLLDIHHNIEDDEEFSNLLINILARTDSGLEVDQATIQLAREELHSRIDSINREYGIHLNFDFVIFHTGNQEYYFKSKDILRPDVNFQKKSVKAGWRIREELGEGKYRLGLHFHNEFFYILRQLKFILALSILIILLLGFSFWRTIRGWQQQKQLVEMKNDFINNLTHELKTPIFSISLLHKIIRKKINGHSLPQLERHLELLEKENDKLKERVEKVLDLGLMEHNRLNLDLMPLNLHQLVPDSLQMTELIARQQGGKINYQFAAENPVVLADPVHLSNVFYNLTDNALKYCERYPSITIRTKTRRDWLVVEIEDNGIGIDPQFKEHIFEKFYRVPTGNLHTTKGIGLGLSYTRYVVERFGGQIELTRSNESGSMFTINFPVYQTHNGKQAHLVGRRR
jgi:two-component system phosphate regulon sensor histidine kinase PhoR